VQVLKNKTPESRNRNLIHSLITFLQALRMAPTTKEVVLPPSFNLAAHLTFEVLTTGDAVVVRTVDESKEELAQLRKGDELVAAAG